jgi:hypothetical protein
LFQPAFGPVEVVEERGDAWEVVVVVPGAKVVVVVAASIFSSWLSR